MKTAIKLGYHHLDGAEVYNTERELGLAINESGVEREKLFVTTKVVTNIADISNAINSSLEKLQLSYVDLYCSSFLPPTIMLFSIADRNRYRYLIHAPFFAKSDCDLQEAWAAMEKVKEAGKARSIGVSNFLQSHLEIILKTAKIPPAVNQIEFHPYLQHKDLVPFHENQGIKTVSYGPLTPVIRAKGGPLDELLSTLADKYAVSAEEILLRWAIDLGVLPVTTSSKESRLNSYLRALSFKLTTQEVTGISEVGRKMHFRAFWQDKFAADDRS